LELAERQGYVELSSALLKISIAEGGSMVSRSQGEGDLEIVKARLDQLERDLFRSKSLIVAVGFGLLVALGLSWENISSKIEAVLKQSAIGTFKKRAEESAEIANAAASGASQVESRAKISVAGVSTLIEKKTATIEALEQKLKNGQFEGDILVKGNVVAQGKVSSAGGLGRGKCMRIDASHDDEDLWCPEGFYVAGAKNYSRSSYILDMIYCCPLG
jgi:hypothetical protein